MDYLATIFVPTGNRRLNELIGFLMCVSALLLSLALVSYSPLDPSWNSASVLTGAHAARNWIGVVGAYTADALLQFFGVGAFLLVIFPAMLGVALVPLRQSAIPTGQEPRRIWLVMFAPALLALLPGQMRWKHVIPVEGLMGRVVGDFLIHYLNIIGAYIVCATFWRLRFIFRPHSRSRPFSFGLPRVSPSSPHCGTATRIGSRSAPRGASRRNSRSAAFPSRS